MAFKELSIIHDSKNFYLISFGSGGHRSIFKNHSNQIGRYISFVKTAIDLVTNTKNVHKHMLNLAKQTNKFIYFRFDVSKLEHITMDQLVLGSLGKRFRAEEERTVAYIRVYIQEYLNQGKIRESIKSCAQVIIDSRRRQEILSSKSSQEPKNRTYRQLKNITISRNNAFCGREKILQCMITLDLYAGI